MSAKPCQICGCTDLNLVDGYFYCVECGTQDMNVRETVVIRTIHDDELGVYTGTDTKKIGTVLKKGFQMSAEWCKWHAYNFILVGLLDELTAAGAEPTVKQKALWIWLRYIKKFQKKEEPEATLFENNTSNEDNIPNEDKSEDDEEETCEENTDTELDESQWVKKKRGRKIDPDKFSVDIEPVNMSLLLAIIYIALNLDRSDIQLSHLFQFMREDRLSVYYCCKFIPKELPFKKTPHYFSFISSVHPFRYGRCKPRRIRQMAMTLMKRLDLGVPVVPDLNKITDNFIKELCLPNDFRDLVYSLTGLLPCDFIEMDAKTMTCSVLIPDYEAYCMAYILLGLKMCFGLDSDYEIKLSDAADKINNKKEYLKSYKLGMHSEPTDRLFSFQEWYTFIQTRKMILCKYYLPLAILYQLPVNDCLYMEHKDHRQVQSLNLSYEVTMNILNKIPTNKHANVIPKKEFPATLTPLTTYTEFIKEHIDDPDVKLRLSEDFTQYSLKYATRDLKLPRCKISEGVDTKNKILNLHLTLGNLPQKEADTNMVLVRHCDNKHWLKTKPPGIKHVTKRTCNVNDISDDSSTKEMEETEMYESGPVDVDSDEDTCDFIVEEDEEISIFDDDFKNLNFIINIHEDDKMNYTYQSEEERDDFEFHFKAVSQEIETDMHATKNDMYGSEIDIHDTFSEVSCPGIIFDPQTFNREKAIKELIENACKKYKIPVPKDKEYGPRKRKIRDREVVGSESRIKRKRGKEEKPILNLINAYYENINNDILFQLTEHLKSVFETTESKNKGDSLNNITDNAPSNITENAPNNITNDGLNNIVDVALNDQTDIQNENIVADALGDGTSVLGDGQIASFHDNNTQEDTADSEVDQHEDDGKFNIEEILPKTDPKFDPKTHDIKQLYVNLKDEFDFIYFSEIDNDPNLNDMIDKKIEEFRDLNVNKTHKNGTGIPSQKNSNGNSETQGSDSNELDNESIQLDEQLCDEPMRKKHQSNLEYLIRNRRIRMFKYWIKSYQSRNYVSGTSLDHKFNIELLENCSRTLFFVLNECASITYRSPFILYKKLRYFENEIILRYRADQVSR